MHHVVNSRMRSTFFATFTGASGGFRTLRYWKNSGGSISMGIDRAGGDGIVMPRKPLRVPSMSWSDEKVWSSLATMATSA